MTTGHIRILAISIACMLCACLVDSASAQPQAAPTYYFCLSHPTPDTAYFSGVFVGDYSIDGDARAWLAAGERDRRSMGHAPVPGPAPRVQQFDQVVAQTYPRIAKGAGSCSSFGTLAEAQKRLDAVIQYEQSNKYKGNKTGWKYAPAAGAPSAIGAAAGQASTAVASAPTAASGTAATQGKIYFCTNRVVLDQQNRKYKEFWSDVFASDAEQANLTSAWRVYLATTYQLNPNDGRQINGGCGDETTVQLTREWKANAKQRWERETKILQDRVAAGSPGIVEQHTVVDTGWKYTPNPNAAPPVPAASRPVDPCVISGVGMATRPPAGCVAPVTSYTVCSAGDASTAYVSAAFAVTDAEYLSWVNGFTQFLAQKYSYQGGGVGCNNMTLNKAPTFLRNRIAALRANKKHVVETGWTFNSVPAVAVEPVPAPVSSAPAAAPVVPAAPATLYAVCWDATAGINDLTAYFGVPFAVTARNNQVWAAAFKSYLNDKYGRTSAGSVSCNVSQSLAQAQQNAQQWKDRYRANRKIVETGWKYQ